ncbi:MAG: hypothetical protein IKS42_05815 [Oscillospiraceae bacterium]|nr:hypothetical protein [Oscillospiraceae bacterium]
MDDKITIDGTNYTDQSKFHAIMSALAGVIYREMRKRIKTVNHDSMDDSAGGALPPDSGNRCLYL